MYRPFPPVDYVASGRGVNTEISGRDQFKFFAKPVVPNINPEQMPERLQPPFLFSSGASPSGVSPLKHAHGIVSQVQQQQLQQQALKEARRPAKRMQKDGSLGEDDQAAHFSATQLGQLGQLTRNAVVQTDYRENDTQTDPYTPDYFVEEGKNPEVLSIMTLKWGEGLPAGLAEVEMIERIRRRKQVEMGLPQGNDDVSMAQRLEQLEKLEQIEWNEREQHIKQLQDERLKQLGEALKTREEKREEASLSRIEAVRQQKLQETEEKLAKLHAKRQKTERQLQAKHENPTMKATQRDIIGDHAKHGQRGKPVTTKSLIEKTVAAPANYDVRPTLLGFPEGVQEVERTEVPRVRRVRKTDLQPPTEITMEDLPTNYRKRQARKVLRDLDFANQTILKAKQGPVGTTSIQDLYRATPRLIRPDTPTLVLEGDEEEEKEEALMLLQRLLRGRSVQNDFFEGKERCHGLIEELQAAQKAKEAQQGRYTKLVQQEKHKERQEGVVEGVLDAIQGDIVYTTLDYLAKELIRQQQAAVFERLRMEGEETRRQREEAEKAKREADNRLREREEAQHAQIAKVNDYTIHTYLNGIITNCVHRAAYRQALDEQVRVIDLEREAERREAEQPPASDAEERREAEVCALMTDFVLPQVGKEMRKRYGQDYDTLSAATGALTEALRDILPPDSH